MKCAVNEVEEGLALPFDKLTALSHSALSSWPKGTVEGLVAGRGGYAVGTIIA
jgi:hypothetical protein